MPDKRPTGFAAFTVIWLGQLVSTLGTRMTNFALSIFIWQQTGRASDLALMTFAAFLATVVFSPIAGSLIDRWNRRLTIVLSDIGSAAATCAILVLFLTGAAQVWQLYVVNLVTGAFLAFQAPAYASTISVMMAKGHYPRANAMLSLAQSVPAIFAPSLAAVLLTVVNIRLVLAIDVASYLLAIATVFLVAIPARPAVEPGERESVWRDSLFGFRYILARPGLLGLQGILFAINLFAAMGWILLTPMVLSRTGNSSAEVGVVLSLGAVGGVVGGLLIGFLPATSRKMARMLWGIVVFSVLGRVLLGVGHSLVVWAIAWSVAWLCIPFIDGYGQAIWQEKVAPAVQGRVFAARNLMDNLALPLALGIAAPLADFVLEPAMRRQHGSLAGLFGGIVGTGPGAGMALVCVFTGLLGVLVAVAGFTIPSVRHVETQLADHDAVPAAEPSMSHE